MFSLLDDEKKFQRGDETNLWKKFPEETVVGLQVADVILDPFV